VPRIVQEDLWKHPGFPGLILVTANNSIKMNGALVMGRGAAAEAKAKIRGIDVQAGKKLSGIFRKQRPGVRGQYGLTLVRVPTEEKIGLGLFQVKTHFASTATLGLIELSTRLLAQYAMMYPELNIRMNYPGIGYGGLERAVVEPILAPLPDNVTICWKEQS
jgi:hypothetical protein